MAALKKATGAKVHMDLADAKGDQMYPLTPDLIDAPWPAGNSEYQVDELTFRIWHTPGHTPGGVVIACGDRLFSGDTLFAGSCGRVDLPGGSPAEMQRSLALVADLPSRMKPPSTPAMKALPPLARNAGPTISDGGSILR